jgi:hypothetical protein
MRSPTIFEAIRDDHQTQRTLAGTGDLDEMERRRAR